MYEYLYAVVEGLPAERRLPPLGPGAAPVVARRVDDLVLVSSAVAAPPRASPKTLALHHDVVAATMDASAVLPFRFGTVLPAGELEPWLAAHATLVRATLARLRGCVELDVKLLRLDRGPGGGTADLRALGDGLVARAGLEHWRYQAQESAVNAAAAVAFLVPRGDVDGFLTRIAPSRPTPRAWPWCRRARGRRTRLSRRWTASRPRAPSRRRATPRAIAASASAAPTGLHDSRAGLTIRAGRRPASDARSRRRSAGWGAPWPRAGRGSPPA